MQFENTPFSWVSNRFVISKGHLLKMDYKLSSLSPPPAVGFRSLLGDLWIAFRIKLAVVTAATGGLELLFAHADLSLYS